MLLLPQASLHSFDSSHNHDLILCINIYETLYDFVSNCEFYSVVQHEHALHVDSRENSPQFVEYRRVDGSRRSLLLSANVEGVDGR